jgi:glycosyltransferase involved in cell wall biosynthesis
VTSADEPPVPAEIPVEDLPAVTVVVPCHNSGPLLREAVLSARQQTHPNVEVIVVDDGSTDKETLEALESVAGPGVRVMRQDNAGPGAARNTAIDAATTPFVLPLDADDRLAPRAAELGARHLAADPEVGMVAGAVRLFGEQDAVRPCTFTGIDSMIHGNTIPISTFRRDDWETVGGYPTEIHRGEDWAFWMRLLRLGRKVAIVDEVCYEYRIWPRQESALNDPVASAEGSNFVMLENREAYAAHLDWVMEELAEQRLMLARFRKTYGRQERFRDAVRRRVRR